MSWNFLKEWVQKIVHNQLFQQTQDDFPKQFELVTAYTRVKYNNNTDSSQVRA